MDHQVFDQLARLLSQAGTRRAALGTLLGAGALGVRAVDAKRRRHKKRNRRRRRVTGEATRRGPLARLRDCPTPGPGQNLSRCNFVDQDLRGANLSGANLSGAVFAHAKLCAATLRGANLSRTDFTFAVLTRADLRGTTLATAILDHAAFCRTQLPNGTLDDSHCPHDDDDICCTDADCDAGVACQRGWCGGRPPQSDACIALGDVCTIGAKPCCPYGSPKTIVCDGSLGIVLTTCQLTCDADADCRRNLGTPDVFCAFGANCFPFEKCCFRKRTRNPKECSSGSSCLITQTLYECCFRSDETCSPVGYGCV
jgi:hypothetical protein